MTYTGKMAKRDSNRALAGYRRRQKDEPDIETEKLADTIVENIEELLG